MSDVTITKVLPSTKSSAVPGIMMIVEKQELKFEGIGKPKDDKTYSSTVPLKYEIDFLDEPSVTYTITNMKMRTSDKCCYDVQLVKSTKSDVEIKLSTWDGCIIDEATVTIWALGYKYEANS